MTQDNHHEFNEDGFCTAPCLGCGDECWESAEHADLPCYGKEDLCGSEDEENQYSYDCCYCNGDCDSEEDN